MNFTKSASHVSIAGIFSSGMIFGAACAIDGRDSSTSVRGTSLGCAICWAIPSCRAFGTWQISNFTGLITTRCTLRAPKSRRSEHRRLKQGCDRTLQAIDPASCSRGHARWSPIPDPRLFDALIAQKFVHHSSAEVHAIYQKFAVNDQAPMLAGIRRYRDAETEIHAILAEASAQRI